MRRNKLVTEINLSVSTYVELKQEAKLRKLRVRWVLGQIPLVEAELDGLSSARPEQDVAHGLTRDFELGDNKKTADVRRLRKRRRHADDCSPTPGGGGVRLLDTTKRKENANAATWMTTGHPPSCSNKARRH